MNDRYDGICNIDLESFSFSSSLSTFDEHDRPIMAATPDTIAGVHRRDLIIGRRLLDISKRQSTLYVDILFFSQTSKHHDVQAS